MSKQTKTAAAKSGNTATRHDANTGKWHTVTRHGRTVMRSPEGVDYEGTPAEIRAVRLYPWRRRKLAKDIRIGRYLRDNGIYTMDEARSVIAGYRRDEIMYSEAYRNINEIWKEKNRVRIEAAARAEGMTADEYERKAIDEAIAKTCMTCGGSIQYTRYELAALDKSR